MPPLKTNPNAPRLFRSPPYHWAAGLLQSANKEHFRDGITPMVILLDPERPLKRALPDANTDQQDWKGAELVWTANSASVAASGSQEPPQEQLPLKKYKAITRRHRHHNRYHNNIIRLSASS